MEYITNLFNNICSEEAINKQFGTKLRKSNISISDALFYRLSYSEINSKKDDIVSFLNCKNNNNISR